MGADENLVFVSVGPFLAKLKFPKFFFWISSAKIFFLTMPLVQKNLNWRNVRKKLTEN